MLAYTFNYSEVCVIIYPRIEGFSLLSLKRFRSVLYLPGDPISYIAEVYNFLVKIVWKDRKWTKKGWHVFYTSNWYFSKINLGNTNANDDTTQAKL